MTFRPGLSATLATLVALIILVSLGTWQALKTGPKTALVASVEAGLAAAPIQLPTASTARGYDYRPVIVEATFLDVTPLRVVNVSDTGKSGYHLYLPARIPSGRVIFVNRGWVPFDIGDLPQLGQGERQQLQGILRISAEKTSFQPDNDLNSDLWYVANIDQMATYYHIDADAVYPLRLFEDRHGDSLPRGGQIRVNIPNNHFQYMLTWWGLGAALLAVYVGFGIKRGRESGS